MSMEKLEAYISQYQNKFYTYSHKEHIEKWLDQFADSEFILNEITHIMNTTYIEEHDETTFFSNLLKNPEIIADIGSQGNYSILDIQQKGKSQNVYSKKMKTVFKDVLDEEVPINDFSKNVLIYVDDFMFTGMKARHDIHNLFDENPKKKIVYFFMGVHSNADDYLKKEFDEKKIEKTVWRCIDFNNSLFHKNNSDVFWPKEHILKDNKVVQYRDTYVGRPLALRSNSSNSIGALELFSSPGNRDKIENEFLTAGLKIVEECGTDIPPMGISAFKGLGFGGTAMSYRNTPNNTPLCLWWGNPNNHGGLGSWYPLLMRRVYD